LINFIIGTKAQFIKCIPVINNFIENDIKISIYDLKQHSEITSKLRNKITDNYEYIEFSKNNKNLGTYFGLMKWFLNNLLKIIFIRQEKLRFQYCFVHGDTLSTLLGSFLVKVNKGKLILLEAGHPVPGIFKHFPESVIRYICAKLSDILIANGKSQLGQLDKWSIKGEIIEISTNTIYDSVSNVKMNKSETNDVIVSIHRTENINSKERMRLLVESISNISKNFNVTWYLHIPTKNKLKSFGLLNSLIKNNVVTEELIEYDIFINKLNNSQFVITDGGGVVEECSIIGIPTLVWRNEHMDQDHIFEKSKNLFLCDYQEKNIDYFFKNYKKFKSEFKKTETFPSNQIVNILKKRIL
jgi:UDP-N-acetylglucosamine 2-epimerase (non-hydrolysing)